MLQPQQRENLYQVYATPGCLTVLRYASSSGGVTVRLAVVSLYPPMHLTGVIAPLERRLDHSPLLPKGINQGKEKKNAFYENTQTRVSDPTSPEKTYITQQLALSMPIYPILVV